MGFFSLNSQNESVFSNGEHFTKRGDGSHDSLKTAPPIVIGV